MEEGKSYLVIEGTSEIKEWECLKVSELAVKVQNKVKTYHSFFTTSATSTDNPFWVLKTKIDTMGDSQYQIIEELK